jgi:hypothetical protein
MKDTQHQSEEKLREELAELRSEVKRLRASEKKLKDMKEAMQKKTHALGERVKELRCLYAMSSLVEKHGSSLENLKRYRWSNTPCMAVSRDYVCQNKGK